MMKMINALVNCYFKYRVTGFDLELSCRSAKDLIQFSSRFDMITYYTERSINTTCANTNSCKNNSKC
jgi:hypothetical protein